MKTKILFFVLLMIVNLSYGQTQTTTYITFGGLIADCNSIKKYGNNQGEHKWKVSHGSPEVFDNGFNKDCRFIAKIDNNGNRLTEGAFANFEFKKDHTYEMKIRLKNSGSTVITRLEILAANSLTESSQSSSFCNEEPTPYIQDEKLIQVGRGTSSMDQYNLNSFKPNKKYDFLLIRSTTEAMAGLDVSSYIDVREIIIIETAPAIPNSCNPLSGVTNLQLTNTSTNGINLVWGLPNCMLDGKTKPDSYAITLKNLTNTEESAINVTHTNVNNSYTFNNVTSCSRYRVSITPKYSPNGQSGTTVNSEIISNKEKIINLSNSLLFHTNCNIPVPPVKSVSASEQVKLLDGFHFRAHTCVNATRTFHAFIDPLCANHNSLRVSSIDYDDDYNYYEEKFDEVVVDYIQIYPNPTSGELYIRGQEKGTIRILNMTGQEIYTSSVLPDTENHINLSSQANGVYFVNYLSDTGESVIEKVVLY